MRFVICIAMSLALSFSAFANESNDDGECQRSWLGYFGTGFTKVKSAAGNAATTALDFATRTASNAASLVGASVANADQIRKRLMQAPQITSQVMDAFDAVATQTAEVSNQIAALAKQAGIVSFNFALATPGTVVMGVYRVLMFSPDNQGIKSGIVIPLVGHLRNIRQYRDAQNNAALAKELNRFVFFVPEALFKLYRCGLSAAQSSGLGVLKAMFGKLTGLPIDGNSAEQGLLKLISAFLGDVYAAFTTPNLSLTQRIELMTDSETRHASVLAEMAMDMGWTDFEVEIAEWRSKNSGDAEIDNQAEDQTASADTDPKDPSDKSGN